MEPVAAVILGLVGALFVLLLYALHLRSTVSLKVRKALAEREREFETRVRDERRDALERSRSVLKGRVGEQLAPLLDFPFEPSDARFIGSPVDYVVFDGYTELKDGDGDGVGLVLLDVKTGNSGLTREQRALRDAVESGMVDWVTLRL